MTGERKVDPLEVCRMFLQWYELLDDDTEFLVGDHRRLEEVVAVARSAVYRPQPAPPDPPLA